MESTSKPKKSRAGGPSRRGHQSEFKPTFYNPNEVKHRQRTTRKQFKLLEDVFIKDPKPSAAIRRELGERLDMTARSVQVWFQNRRAKEKNRKVAADKAALVSDTTSAAPGTEPSADDEAGRLSHDSSGTGSRPSPRVTAALPSTAPTFAVTGTPLVTYNTTYPGMQNALLSTPEDPVVAAANALLTSVLDRLTGEFGPDRPLHLIR
ncbi:hypothetical protein IWQ60_005992 [Tieghemiomyces parasiticus]|uniref:Homeobox domain-containing protein n=1 Tax=Tieghemiomyces parasiticus TaxID=78921 RepID=A0A9W8DU48_9FUNG|nr:hypothetical protein IWQ60_005992 [Tieghemiomyces parasiticus]